MVNNAHVVNARIKRAQRLGIDYYDPRAVPTELECRAELMRQRGYPEWMIPQPADSEEEDGR